MARIDPRAFYNHPNGRFSFYSMHGIERPIVRRKGGASKERIKSDPRFEQTRIINTEFGGRAKASSWIMHPLLPLKSMADHNIAGPLNSLLKPIQEADTISPKGQRSVQLTARPELLNGFSLNRSRTFDHIVRTHLDYEINTHDEVCQILIPALTTRINFYPDPAYPLFSFIGTLGVVPDLFYTPTGYAPTDSTYDQLVPFLFFSPWYPCTEGMPGLTMNLPFMDPPDARHCLMLSIGIRYGRIYYNEQIEQVPRAGAAKILVAQ